MLCKPYRHAVGVRDGMVSLRHMGDTEWVEYGPRNERDLFRFLPHMMAVFLVNNFWRRLRLPDPPRPQSQHFYQDDDRNLRWSMHELNKVLEQMLVPKANGTQLTVLGGVRWESDRFVGSMQLRVRTLDTHYGKKRQVQYSSYTVSYTVSYFIYCFVYCFVFRILFRILHLFRIFRTIFRIVFRILFRI